MPAIRESCESGPCSKVKHHFDECEKRVSSGKGFKGEDCVEELFHMLHCVDNCVRPRSSNAVLMRAVQRESLRGDTGASAAARARADHRSESTRLA